MAGNVNEAEHEISGGVKMFLAIMLVFALFSIVSSFGR